MAFAGLPEPPFGTQKCVPRRFRSFSCFLFECSWSKKSVQINPGRNMLEPSAAYTAHTRTKP